MIIILHRINPSASVLSGRDRLESFPILIMITEGIEKTGDIVYNGVPIAIGYFCLRGLLPRLGLIVLLQLRCQPLEVGELGSVVDVHLIQFVAKLEFALARDDDLPVAIEVVFEPPIEE